MGQLQWKSFFDGFLDSPNRAIVISAGNSHRRNIHASGEITSSSPRDITWQIRNTSAIDNEIELWYSGTEELEATLVDPDGNEIGPFRLGSPEQELLIGGQTVATINHAQEDNSDNRLDIYLHRSSLLPSGNWVLNLQTNSTTPVEYHAWIERTASSVQSSFSSIDADPAMTLGSISCGKKTIAVGSYNPRGFGMPLSSFSSEGPTRDGRQKPEVSAPGGEIGNGILAARSLTHTLRTAMPGTSMAAPHVTGLVALLMQASNSNLDVDDIRDTVMQTARRNPPSGMEWNSRYGFGRIDAREAVRQISPTPLPPTSQFAISNLHSSEGDGKKITRATDLIGQLTTAAASSRMKVKLQLEIEPCDSLYDSPT